MPFPRPLHDRPSGVVHRRSRSHPTELARTRGNRPAPGGTGRHGDPHAKSGEWRNGGRVGGPAYRHGMFDRLPDREESGIRWSLGLAPRDVDVFAVMGDPARRRLVDILASGEHTAGQLAAAVGAEFAISRTAVSKHLRLLRDAGMVDVRAEEQWRWYYLTDEGLRRLEHAVAHLRAKFEAGFGWDTGQGARRDPLRGIPEYRRPVQRKGPGRDLGLGRRGSQTEPPIAGEPPAGL